MTVFSRKLVFFTGKMMKKSPATNFGLFLLISASIWKLCAPCPTKSEDRYSRAEAAVDRITTILEECWNYTAYRQIEQAHIRYSRKNPVWLPALSSPTPDPKGNVRRPYLDETISLVCAPGPTQPNIVWKHNGHVMAAQQTVGDLRYTRTSDNTLILYNITYAAWGKFECLQRCQQNGMEALCLQAEHWVFPKPLPEGHEVFAQRMPPVIVPRYMPFSSTCQLAFPCSQDPQQHFIWRYHGIYLSWPPGHYLQQTSCIETDRQTLMVHTNTSEITGADGRLHCASTLTLHVPWPNHTGAKLACWARSDTTQQQWFILTTPVQFNGSLPFPE
ncbi:uncharacterized protein LOC129597499 [Paramacrobiotus metropolitanus]|uniref:uncharacterized protein LOC129597499 n=1 Tax=Paramacrobiotus metropolitanus TaxID=2943436 RepID=UPI002445D3DA|nr:uncharacterized protein LOC129597499 [Paramacrobiotus metropolitanus]